MASGFIRLAVAALRYAKNYNDANPDVGMGPSMDMLLNDVERMAEVKFSAKDKDEILNLYYKIYGKRR